MAVACPSCGRRLSDYCEGGLVTYSECEDCGIHAEEGPWSVTYRGKDLNPEPTPIEHIEMDPPREPHPPGSMAAQWQELSNRLHDLGKAIEVELDKIGRVILGRPPR